VRALYTGWYREVSEGLPTVKNGQVTVSDRPGLGIELLPGLEKRPDARVRVSKL
jgi:L-alanine-DL-glutamate epimerase-like enolase superfamily enzyme